MPRSPALETHVHELPYPSELHFVRKEKDAVDRLGLVAYDRANGLRDADGFIRCPFFWFDGSGRVQHDHIRFNTSLSKGRIGRIHMPPREVIDMVYQQGAIWSVYSIVGYELSKVDDVDNKDAITTAFSSPDSAFINFINWLQLWLPTGFYIPDTDERGYAKLNAHRRGEPDAGQKSAEKMSKAVYAGFHKLVEQKPEEFFAVKEPEVIGNAAWDGGESSKNVREEKILRELHDVKKRLRNYALY